MSGIVGQCCVGMTGSGQKVECGNEGSEGLNSDEAAIGAMLARLEHRGPDVSWRARQSQCTIAVCQTREREAPSHEYYAADANRVCTLDGSLYDVPGVDLDEAGYGAEAVLRAYRKAAGKVVRNKAKTLAEVLEDIQGKFALALVDGSELLLARDMLGFQPLYYCEVNGSLYFASEIKALQEITADVKEFPAGYIYSSESGWLQFARLPEIKKETMFESVDEAARELRAVVEEAVKRRIADGRIKGVFLSGGLDSSIVAYVARKYVDNLHTFTVGTADGHDIRYARQVADYLGTNHHEYMYSTEDIIEIAPKVVYHLESYVQAFIRGSVANYFAARLASKYTPAVLCGEGPDELFAGYHFFKDVKELQNLERLLPEIIKSLHKGGCQRLDRMGASNQLEVRAPFLDKDVIKCAFRIPIEWKLDRKNKIEKWILRKAFAGCLPDEVIWREKRQFARGAGSLTALEQLSGKWFTDKEFSEACKETGTPELESKEELYYYRIFSRYYEPDLAKLAGTWNEEEYVKGKVS